MIFQPGSGGSGVLSVIDVGTVNSTENVTFSTPAQFVIAGTSESVSSLSLIERGKMARVYMNGGFWSVALSSDGKTFENRSGGQTLTYLALG